MAKARRASTKPSEFESGGVIGFPAGSRVKVKEVAWTTWEEAGEKAIKKDRQAEDPCLKIVGRIKGQDEDVIEFLSAGKATRLQPSRDGEFLEIPEGSTASALTVSSNAGNFVDTVFYKDKKSRAYKMHGNMALPEDDQDDGISCLNGLEFVAGREVIQRDNQEGMGKPRPSLIAEEIVKKPGGKSSDDDEDEEEEAPKRKKKPAAEEEDDDEEEPAPKKKAKKPAADEEEEEDEDSEEGDAESTATEKIEEVIANPKYRKGVPGDKLFTSVYNLIKDLDKKEVKAVMEFVEDTNWISSKKRPWSYDTAEELLTAKD